MSMNRYFMFVCEYHRYPQLPPSPAIIIVNATMINDEAKGCLSPGWNLRNTSTHLPYQTTSLFIANAVTFTVHPAHTSHVCMVLLTYSTVVLWRSGSTTFARIGNTYLRSDAAFWGMWKPKIYFLNDFSCYRHTKSYTIHVLGINILIFITHRRKLIQMHTV